jgi:L-2-hydroxycarboxylate dehydrogenase (NAD+)
MPNVEAPLLERLTREIFVARGVPEDDAAFIASMLIRANLRGHDSHGVIRVPQYVAALQRGTLNPKPQMKLVVDTPTLAILEGDGGFGQVVARRGVGLAIERWRYAGPITSAGSPTTPRWPRPRD